MKLETYLDETGNIDVCNMETGEVVAIFKGCYYDIGKRGVNKWIKDNGYKKSHIEQGWDRLTVWVVVVLKMEELWG